MNEKTNGLRRQPDPAVLQFIDSFIQHEGESNVEVIRHLFRAGYCYYFATMLQTAFGRGKLCLAYPFGHIVWLDGDDETVDVAYDIEGVYEGEADYLVPVEFLCEAIEDFMHVPGKTAYADAEMVRDIGRRYQEAKRIA